MRDEVGRAPANACAIPLDQIEPHPRLAFRFSYDVKTLADLIRSTADENTPNGQLNPGRVVEREGGGYYVYIGVRRFLALKALHGETREERFSVFNAYVDGGVSELRMFARAKAENEEARGERQRLSILEEVAGIKKIRDSIDPSELEGELRRLYDLAGKLSDSRIAVLFKAEMASPFKFTLGHVERLCGIEGEKEFVLTAASVAGFGFNSDEIDAAMRARNAAYSLVWFRKVFPEYEAETWKPAVAEDENETNVQEKGKGDSNRLEVHEEDVIVIPCPRCRSENMVRLEGEVKATHLPPDPDGERRTELAEGVASVRCECHQCGGEFYLFAKHIAGKSYATEPSFTKKLREPKKVVESVDLRFDFKLGAWQKIVGDKIVGKVQVGPPGRKR